jgi:predicted small integral membrane protein
MTIRLLKILLVVCVSLNGLIYAVNNLVNWDAGVGAVGAILSMAGHAVYADAFAPPITSPVLHKFAFLVIIGGEFAVAILAGKGAFDLWSARSAPAAAFNEAKTWALLGCGMAILVWFGLFHVLGGAWFQMWQTDLGQGSLKDAFSFAALSGLVLLYLNQPETS